MADILASINTRKTSQKEKSRPDQVKNRAGGYVFQIGDEERLHRFLTLGTDGPTYYASAHELTRENADVVFRMAASKPDELIEAIVTVSTEGRAPKNKQAIFALAIAASADDTATRTKAMAVMHRVCRTGTHVFEFNKYVEQFRGRGPSLNKAVAKWYLNKPVDKLAYQVTKYRQRDGWQHRDLLRLTKPGQYGPKSPERDALFDFIIKGNMSLQEKDGHLSSDLAIVYDYLDAQGAVQYETWAEIIHRGNGLSWEMLPDAALSHPAVWEALLEQGIPQTALMRQLPRLTNVFGGPGNWVSTVATQLQDAEKLKRGRVHPVNVLVAQKTYQQGHGFRGKLSWSPVTGIVDALDAAFYNAYGAVEPSGKRILIGLDVSGSMGSTINELPLQAREAASALALVTMATEPAGNVEVVGFTAGHSGGAPSRRFGVTRTGLAVPIGGYNYGGYSRVDAVTPLDISPRRRLDDVLRATAGLPLGATDCALPFTWANENDRDFDVVLILTDNESWAGPIHVHQAAEMYRNKVGHDVKLIAAAMTATNYSVVDPKDRHGLNVSGFDQSVPQLISDFAASRL